MFWDWFNSFIRFLPEGLAHKVCSLILKAAFINLQLTDETDLDDLLSVLKEAYLVGLSDCFLQGRMKNKILQWELGQTEE